MKKHFIAVTCIVTLASTNSFGQFVNPPTITPNTAVVATGGSVGIGTANPAGKLDVLNTGNQLRLSNTASVFSDINTSSAGNLIFTPNTGKVAFGIAAPASGIGFHSNMGVVRISDPLSATKALQVSPNFSANGDIPAGVALLTPMTLNTEGLSLLPNGSGTTGTKVGAYVFSNGAGSWKSVWESANVASGNPNLLLVRSGGNVGVGTIIPDKILTVVGTGVNTQVAKFADNARYIGIGRDEVAAFDLSGNPANMYIGGQKLNILTTGEVGIATTTPYKKLTVNGDAALISNSAINALEILGNGQVPNRRGISLDNDPSGKFNFYIHQWETNASFNFKNSLGDVNLVSILVNGSMVVGNVSTPAGYKLYVESGILTEKVKVALKTTSDWSDYVFAKDYKLKSLAEVNAFINTNKHLPGVPSATELVENGGFDLGKMDAKLLEKIEELTLYIIQLDKTNKELADRLDKLESNK